MRRWFSFISLHVSLQFSQHHLLNNLSLTLVCACFLFQKNIFSGSAAQVVTREQTRHWQHYVPFWSLGCSAQLAWNFLLESSSLQLWDWGPCSLLTVSRDDCQLLQTTQGSYDSHCHRLSHNVAAYFFQTFLFRHCLSIILFIFYFCGSI